MSKDKFLKKLGANIARLRKEAKLTQVELAQRCDKDKQSLNRLENGNTNPTAYTLKQIADELGTTLKDLFDFE
jgi:transcriptional regulator with XRE-family HTH domain